MTSTRYLLAALFIVTGLAGGAYFTTQAWHGHARQPERATVLPVALPLPEFTLTDHRGDALTPGTLSGAWHLLFFGFTHCPDICPATLQQLSMARAQLAKDGQTPLPDILFISVDPARDSPGALAAYVDHFGDALVGATGTPGQLQRLTGALGIHFDTAPPDDEGNYAVSHSAAVLLIDTQARLKAVFSAPHDVESFVSDVPLIVSDR